MWATLQLPIWVEKISYKHPLSLKETIDIILIQNDPVVFESILTIKQHPFLGA